VHRKTVFAPRNMAPTTITYDSAKVTVGTLPSLAPRPNAVNIRALTLHLEQKLETIPSTQSPENGYVGLVMPDEIYALRSPNAWIHWPDPGPHPAAAATNVEARNLQTLYDSNKAVFDSDQNVRRAVNDALNLAIPKEFRKPIGNQIGTKVFTVRDDPKQILVLELSPMAMYALHLYLGYTYESQRESRLVAESRD